MAEYLSGSPKITQQKGVNYDKNRDCTKTILEIERHCWHSELNNDKQSKTHLIIKMAKGTNRYW